jgi:hypothetical protein
LEFPSKFKLKIRSLLLIISLIVFTSLFLFSKQDKIDRFSLVNRHNPIDQKADAWSPFTVGNGGFAFTADITGLQTFPDYYYKNGIPLQIISDWGWHSFPNPEEYKLKDAFKYYNVHGKKIGYPTNQDSKAGKWLRENPHRIPLGQIGFGFKKQDGSTVKIKDIKNIFQKLDLWKGVIESKFEFEGKTVEVETICNPDKDDISVNVKSPLISEKKLFVIFKFPYSYIDSIKNNPPYEWNNSSANRTSIIKNEKYSAELERTVDTTHYFVAIRWSGDLKFNQESENFFKLIPNSDKNEFTFSAGFSGHEVSGKVPSFEETKYSSIKHWENFWNSGGAVDLSGSTDPRANELERRIILSEYLTATQFAGNFPPQETGLMLSSWFGKHNTEMIWWHAAQFALWNRVSLLEKNLEWYIKTLPYAEATAEQQGFKGARWSKMVDPSGRESPGNNPFIIWNEPHPIYLAELCYRARHEKETLEKYKALVFKTADFLSSYAYFDKAANHYVLGPPVWPVQEIYDPLTAQNPSFELAYWKFGLELAQEWRERLGMNRNSKWDDIIKKISPLPVKDSLYVVLGSKPDTFTNPENEQDHPEMLMSLGFLPRLIGGRAGDMVNPEIMRRTLNRVIKTWHWKEKIWGWDYPMMAMTAVRLNEPETAVDILLMDAPHNHYLNNGNCPQTEDLPVYLPANSALLAAAALMTAGSDESGSKQCPGFPKNGKWKVKFENINKMP